MIAQFAVRLICGMSLTWLLMPRGKVTTGFFRIQTLVTLGLAVLAAAALTLGKEQSVAEHQTWLSHRAAVVLSVWISLASYVASVLWGLGTDLIQGSFLQSQTQELSYDFSAMTA